MHETVDVAPSRESDARAEFIAGQCDLDGYAGFARKKVCAGRASMHAGLGRPNEEVEAEFAALRASVVSQA